MGRTWLMVNFFYLLCMISSRMCVSIILLIMSMITGIMMTMIARLFFLCFSCWWRSNCYRMSDMFSFRMGRCWFMCMICLVISSCVCCLRFHIFSSRCGGIACCQPFKCLAVLKNIILMVRFATDERCDGIAQCPSDEICYYPCCRKAGFKYSLIDDISYSFCYRLH